MKERNLAFVFFISLVTFGIYYIVWLVKTKGEMARLGASVPTSWLLIVPIANIYWLYMYYRAAEQVTVQVNGVALFAAHLILSIVSVFLNQGNRSGETVNPGLWLASLAVTLAFLAVPAYLRSKYNRVRSTPH